MACLTTRMLKRFVHSPSSYLDCVRNLSDLFVMVVYSHSLMTSWKNVVFVEAIFNLLEVVSDCCLCFLGVNHANSPSVLILFPFVLCCFTGTWCYGER